MLRIFFALLVLGFCGVLALAGLRGLAFVRAAAPDLPGYGSSSEISTAASERLFCRWPLQPEMGRWRRADGLYFAGTLPPGRGDEIARYGGSFSNQPDYANTGRMGEVYGDGLPLEVTDALLDRGEERFNIHCAVCHGRTGHRQRDRSDHWQLGDRGEPPGRSHPHHA